ncbi:desulfoferrodoxin [Halobacteroides halobius DSM 5150]|uniref:Desulfoferrodoxin n=1 Tax=Halobacteroides halobius (strain ATCC 35273 / DSM 5150 / MD-1) TaxID=748449 RepID=L0K6V2_HALHC|nr:desulfoferrodoxin [Halobacteroides halobius]AGB40751.1 desulfoferrodoxin [Halobacteroides halobius DSM 5150]
MKKRGIYKCQTCANVVEGVNADAPDVVCCGKTMNRLEAQTDDASNEKHVPVINELDQGVEIVVGTTLHPMEDKHYIAFIEVLTEDKVLRAELKPGDKPQAKFNIDKSKIVEVREYCTVHDLWKA